MTLKSQITNCVFCHKSTYDKYSIKLNDSNICSICTLQLVNLKNEDPIDTLRCFKCNYTNAFNIVYSTNSIVLWIKIGNNNSESIYAPQQVTGSWSILDEVKYIRCVNCKSLLPNNSILINKYFKLV